MVDHILFLIACFATGVISSGMIGPCKVSDQHCIDVSIRAALPDVLSANTSLGVESSDPLFLEKIEANLQIIKYVFRNSTVVGFKSCNISNIRLARNLSNFNFVLKCKNIKVSGKYEMSGHLAKLPIEGKGDYHISAGKYIITIETKVKKYTGRDGKKHLAITNFEMESEALSELKCDFKNHGQKDLSDTAHKYAKVNWLEVAELVQGPVWYKSLSKLISNVNKYLRSVTLEHMLIV